MAGRIAPPRGSRPLKKRTGSNQTPRSAPRSLRAIHHRIPRRPCGTLRPLPVRTSGRRLAQDAADACLEGKVPRILRRKPGDNVAGLHGDPPAAGETPGEVTSPASTLASRVPRIRSSSEMSPTPVSRFALPVSVLTSPTVTSPLGASTSTSPPTSLTNTSPASAPTVTLPEIPETSTSPTSDSTSTEPPVGILSV